MKTTAEKPHLIAYWLFFCAALVFLMVSVGAITRLQNAGLSMVEWRPLMGTLPPLSETEWTRVFELYKQFPEYQKKHFWMELHDFKLIFFWEWFHRFLGRFIGLAYALPLAFFWWRGIIPAGYGRKLLALLILGGLQGLMGWYMVKSGLVDRPDVSAYRLAAHLGLAFLIFGLLLWNGLSLLRAGPKRIVSEALDKRFRAHVYAAFALALVTIFWGALTAGLDAGLVYNETFPKMGAHWLPPEVVSSPLNVRDFLENPVNVQLVHRWLAMLTALMVLSLWVHALYRKCAFAPVHGLMGAVLLQVGLGVMTLLSGLYLPLAVMHQATALFVFSLFVAIIQEMKSRPPS